MQVTGVAGRFVAAMGLLGVGLAACQWVAGIEDIELTSSSSAAASSSGAGTGGMTGASSSSSSGAASTSASGAGGAMSFEYAANVSDCVNTAMPNPDTCAQAAGAGRLRIDIMDNNTLQPYHAFLRFDLDNKLAGRTPTKVTLYLTTTNDSSAPSDKSGEIWEVGTFDHNSLFGNVPANMGGAPVAGDVGQVVKMTTYSWPLPVSLVGAGKSVYLGLEPVSSDYALYWNKDGMTPPKLVIDAQ